MKKEIRINERTALRIYDDNSVKLIVYRRCPKSAVWGENESNLYLEDIEKLINILWEQADKMGWKPNKKLLPCEIKPKMETQS